MGGGDLNMKKSWHPLLLKNQERVWLEEKKALEEKKKLDQLRKEKEEERQLQELQRLQEEQTGKKRTEKLEWMYTTPATGTSQNPNDLEDYLLGKKRVDKILTADENAKVGASHKNFIAVQNANNARDIAAKIREDPLLAIKQQEQAAYQALMSNPLRLREMQERNGIKPQKDKKDKKREKEEKKRLKHERRKERDRDSRSRSPVEKRLDSRLSPSYDRYSRSRRSRSPYYRRSRSPMLSRSRYDDDRGNVRRDDYSSRMRERSRSRSPRQPYRPREASRSLERDSRMNIEKRQTWPRSDESDDSGNAGSRVRSRSMEPRGHTSTEYGKRQRCRSPGPYGGDSPTKRLRVDLRSSPPHSYRPPNGDADKAIDVRTARLAAMSSNRPPNGDADKAIDVRTARLAAMSSNASCMTVERQERLALMLEKEKAELAAEERARAKSKGMGGFLSHEQKKVFGGGGGLEERIRRGKGGMVVDAD